MQKDICLFIKSTYKILMDKENIFLDLPPDAPIMIRGYAR